MTGKLTSLLLATFLSASLCHSQQRFYNEVFTQVNLETVTYSDVYGQQMDVYQPEGDTVSLRPLIVFAHGGAFYAGSKNNSTAVDFCETFAKRGYVTASINYRLAPFQFYLLDSLAILDQAMKAVGDAKAAIRYFRKSAGNGNPYRIDAEQVFFAGNSAGAIIGLNLAALDSLDNIPGYLRTIMNNNGGLQGDSGNPGYSSEVNAVINLAGGISYLHFLDVATPPVGSCHGDMDGVVPFDCNDVYWAHPQYGSVDLVNLCGSSKIHPVLDSLEVENELLVFVNADHTPWSANQTDRDAMIDFSVDFLFRQLDRVSSLRNSDLNSSFSIRPNPVRDHFSIDLPDKKKKVDLEIRDLTGRLLRKLSSLRAGDRIERKGAAAGCCYYLRITDEKGVFLGSRKLIYQ